MYRLWGALHKAFACDIQLFIQQKEYIEKSVGNHKCLRFFICMKKYKVPFSLIRFACDNELLDTLHYYYMLRVASENRMILNFSYKSASKFIKASVGTTHYQIKKMLSLGWVNLQANGTLTIKGVNKLKRSAKERAIQVPIEQTKKAQILQFRYVLIHQNLKLQERKINKKTDLVKKARTPNIVITKKEIKVLTKNGGVDRFSKSILNRVTLSNKKFGKILCRSQCSGKSYQKAMNKANLVSSKAFFEDLGRLDSKLINQARKEYDCYYLIVDANGVLKKRGSNNISPLL